MLVTSRRHGWHRTKIVNPLGIGASDSRCTSWMLQPGVLFENKTLLAKE